MKCRDIMKSNVETIGPGDPVSLAAEKMKLRNVGFLPVVTEEGVVLGALTDRDITIRIVAEQKAPSTPVVECMSHEVVSCSPDLELKAAERLMGRHQKSRVLCCDEQGRLSGVISLSDIAQHEGAFRTNRVLVEVTAREAHG